MTVGRDVFGLSIRPKPDRHNLGQGPDMRIPAPGWFDVKSEPRRSVYNSESSLDRRIGFPGRVQPGTIVAG